MKDIIILNETIYRCTVKTGLATVTLEFENGDYNVLKKVFKSQTELSLANQDGKVYATYSDLTFVSIEETTNAVSIVFSTEKEESTLDADTESRIKTLEECVEDLATSISALAEQIDALSTTDTTAAETTTTTEEA